MTTQLQLINIIIIIIINFLEPSGNLGPVMGLIYLLLTNLHTSFKIRFLHKKEGREYWSLREVRFWLRWLETAGLIMGKYSSNIVGVNSKLFKCIHLNINQLDALNFIMSLFHASTCFEHHVFIVRRSKLCYTVSGIITLKQVSGLKLLK